MNLLPMSYFIEVASQKGISRAAERLRITQQTLSTHIAALEKELGCTLFVRRPKFRLTAEGELFLEYCKRFTELDRTMRQAFGELRGEITGTVRTGISQTRSAVLMPELIEEFRAEYPKVKILLNECTNDELLTKIGNDELDVIIGNVSEERPDLVVYDLYQERMALVVPRKQEFRGLAEAFRKSGDLKLLSGYPVITNSRNDIVGRYISRVFLENRIPPDIAAVSDSAETCLRLCAKGTGVYLCPDLYTGYFRELQPFWEVFPLPYICPIHIAVRNRPRQDPLTERFVMHCLKAFDTEKGTILR